MGERYWITGVQLGLLEVDDLELRKKTIKSVFDNQFIGNFKTQEEQKTFKTIMNHIEIIMIGKVFADMHIKAHSKDISSGKV